MVFQNTGVVFRSDIGKYLSLSSKLNLASRSLVANCIS